MMKLDLSPTYCMPITLQVRQEDGQLLPETFTGHFLRMGTDEFESYRQTLVAEKTPDMAIARHVLRGWSDMKDAAGAPVPFDAAHLNALLLGVQGAPVAIVRIWMASVLEELRKNLLPPPSTGSAAEPGPTTTSP